MRRTVRNIKANTIILILYCISVGFSVDATAAIIKQNKSNNTRSHNLHARSISSDKVFLSAKLINFNKSDGYVEAIGDVIVFADGYTLFADSLLYDITEDELWAIGHVRVKDAEKVILGTSALVKHRLKQVVVNNFIARFKDDSIIAASVAESIDKDHGALSYATYTPCKMCNNKKPLWEISAKKTYIDLQKEKVVYKNAVFTVYGLPVFFTPYFTHPTPDAKAQSGILVPDVARGALRVPLYYRAKSNLDFTLSPRINSKYTIYEGEARHLLENGQYNIKASTLRSTLIHRNKGGDIINSDRIYRYHVNTSGRFTSERLNYGFDVNRTSDKSYLKNYYNINDPYLTSKIYVNKIDGKSFYAAEGLAFQGLQAWDRAYTDPSITPEIRIKQTSNIFDDKNTYLTLTNNTMHYAEGAHKNLMRTATAASVMHLHQSDSGQLFSVEGYNRLDIYRIARYTQYDIEQITHTPSNNKNMARSIPELRVGWRYPLIKATETGRNILLEPQMKLTVGQNKWNVNRKYDFVDVNYYNISEENLFESNKYSGVDYHEYGTRVGYGMYTLIDFNNGYGMKGFLGKLHYLTPYAPRYSKVNNVGSVAFISNKSDMIYYKFRRDYKFRPYHQDIGISGSVSKISGSAGFINTKPIQYIAFAHYDDALNQKVRQSYVDMSYALDDNWSVGTSVRMDMLHKNSLLYRSMKVTYKGDCATIELRMGNDYTVDTVRNIRKTGGYSIALGLKNINM